MGKTTRCKHTAEFKVKVAIEAPCEQSTLSPYLLRGLDITRSNLRLPCMGGERLRMVHTERYVPQQQAVGKGHLYQQR